MTKALSGEQLAAMSAKSPEPTMTRAAKLKHWAALVEAAPNDIVIGDRLEHLSARERNMWQHPRSAFAIAFADKTLKDAGLAGPTIGDAKKFFEISDEQVHQFSCYCGGAISRGDMADRIRNLAASRSPVRDAAAIAAISFAGSFGLMLGAAGLYNL